MKKIFVFGSNLAGVHGAGSAAHALEQHGAKWGIGVGYRGNSYAIPTKDHHIQTMSIGAIKPYVDDFLDFTRENQEFEFNIVAIGCGLAGYAAKDIAPLFAKAPSNCKLPLEFENYRAVKSQWREQRDLEEQKANDTRTQASVGQREEA